MFCFLRPIHVVPTGSVRLESRWCDAPVLRSSQTGRPLILAYQESGPPCPAAAPMPLRVQRQLEYRKLCGNGRLTDGDGRNSAECVAFICPIDLEPPLNMRY